MFDNYIDFSGKAAFDRNRAAAAPTVRLAQLAGRAPLGR